MKSLRSNTQQVGENPVKRENTKKLNVRMIQQLKVQPHNQEISVLQFADSATYLLHLDLRLYN